MRRAVAAVGAACALLGAVAGPAAARTDDTKKPIIFVAGHETGSADCGKQFDKLISRLRAMKTVIGSDKTAQFTGPFVKVSPYDGDRECKSIGGGNGDDSAQSGRRLAKYIQENYTSKDPPVPVDIVGYGSGGVVIRQALGLTAVDGVSPLLVEDVVTVGTPHGGAPGAFAAGCRNPICQDVDTNLASGRGVVAKLKQPPFAHPVGVGGTDWSTIASKSDEIVKPESANGMEATDHKTTYLAGDLFHAKLLDDVSGERDAKIEYQHGAGPLVQWNKAPHVADRVGLELIFGAGQKGGPGNGCTGHNDDESGPRFADSEGLVTWPEGGGVLGLIKVGAMEAYATCFTKLSAGKYASDGVVRVNGVDFTPERGQRIIVDTIERRVSTILGRASMPTRHFNGKAVPLSLIQPLDWKLPAKPGGAVESLKLGGEGRIGGFKLKGEAAVKFGQGSTSLEVNLGLPGMLQGRSLGNAADAQCRDGRDNDNDGGIDYVPPAGAKDDADCLGPQDPSEGSTTGLTIGTTLRSDNGDGLRLDEISGELKTESLKIGRFTLEGGAKFSYNAADNLWKFDATIQLPIPPRSPEVSGGFDLKEGSVTDVRFSAPDLKIPIGTTPVLFQDVRIGIRPDPFQLRLGVGLSVFPRVIPRDGKTVAPVDINGDMTLDARELKLEGAVLLVGEPFATGSLEYSFLGSGAKLNATVGPELEFAGEGDKPTYVFKAKLQAKMDATINQSGLDANLTGKACLEGKIRFIVERNFEETCLGQSEQRLTVRETRVTYSACGKLDLTLWSGQLGFGMTLNRATRRFQYRVAKDVCGFADWHDAGSLKAAGAGPGQRTVQVGGTPEAEMFAIAGDGAPPGVALTGPDGKRRDANGAGASGELVNRGDYAVMHSDADDTTYVVVAKPAAGAWNVEPQPGSSGIQSVQTASALPKPDVKARVVRRKGGRYELRYTTTPRPGQTIAFEETGRNVTSEIGQARGRGGTIPFRPAFGPGGRRVIVARVEQNGMPRTEIAVASYTAPAPRMAGRPRGVSVKRRGSRLIVSWKRTPLAYGYRVQVRTPQSRNADFQVSAKRRRVVLTGVYGRGKARVNVRAIRRDGSSGPAARP